MITCKSITQKITLEVNKREVTLTEKELQHILAIYYASQERAAKDAESASKRAKHEDKIRKTCPKQTLTSQVGQKIVLAEISEDGRSVAIYSEPDSGKETINDSSEHHSEEESEDDFSEEDSTEEADDDSDEGDSAEEANDDSDEGDSAERAEDDSDEEYSDEEFEDDSEEEDSEEEFDDNSDDEASAEESGCNGKEDVPNQEDNSTCNSGNSNLDVTTTSELDEMFPIVDIEGISLDDKFMQYIPKCDGERIVMSGFKCAKKMGLKNFRMQKVTASYSKDKKEITFVVGADPACKKDAMYWKKVYKNFMPEKDSRMCTDLHWNVFLVTLIKHLVEVENWRVSDAWRAVCRNSKELGKYCNTSGANRKLEKTGSQSVGKWCDVMGVCKIVEEYDNPNQFIVVSGSCLDLSYNGYFAAQRSITDNNIRDHVCGSCMIMNV